MDFVQLLTGVCPSDLKPIFQFIKYGVYPIIQIGIPILLILMGTIDLGKAVLSSDDKEIKGATSKLIKRAIAAVAVFFVATIVSLIMGMFSTSGAEDAENVDLTYTDYDWKACWKDV